LEDVKTIATKENTSSVSLHPDHKKFVAGSDEDLWVRIYDFESGEVSGKKSLSFFFLFFVYFLLIYI
jgi:WD40 repeat protein